MCPVLKVFSASQRASYGKRTMRHRYLVASQEQKTTTQQRYVWSAGGERSGVVDWPVLTGLDRRLRLRVFVFWKHKWDSNMATHRVIIAEVRTRSRYFSFENATRRPNANKSIDATPKLSKDSLICQIREEEEEKTTKSSVSKSSNKSEI